MPAKKALLMTIFDVIPGEGVGPVRLGMTLAEARAAMPEGRESFMKGAEAVHQTDSWFDSGFQVFYKGQPALVHFIELSRDCGFEARCFGVPIFATPADEVVNRLSDRAALDIDDPELGCSYVFPSLELAVWRPFMPETDDDEEARYFSTIGVGSEGYYSGAAKR